MAGHPWKRGWWSQAGSNRRPLACHASALPAELWPHVEARRSYAEPPCNCQGNERITLTVSMRPSRAREQRSRSVARGAPASRRSAARRCHRRSPHEAAERACRARPAAAAAKSLMQPWIAAADQSASRSAWPVSSPSSEQVGRDVLAHRLVVVGRGAGRKNRLCCAISFRVLARSRCACDDALEQRRHRPCTMPARSSCRAAPARARHAAPSSCAAG